MRPCGGVVARSLGRTRNESSYLAEREHRAGELGARGEEELDVLLLGDGVFERLEDHDRAAVLRREPLERTTRGDTTRDSHHSCFLFCGEGEKQNDVLTRDAHMRCQKGYTLDPPPPTSNAHVPRSADSRAAYASMSRTTASKSRCGERERRDANGEAATTHHRVRPSRADMRATARRSGRIDDGSLRRGPR